MKKETNLEYYLPELKMLVKEAYGSPKLIFTRIKRSMDPEIKSTQDTYTGDILDWMAQPHEMSILDSKEKKYLSEVIRPFRKEVKAIRKQEDPADPAGKEYIQICLEKDRMNLPSEKDLMTFPSFEKGEMYEGLEPYKNYTPEDLGL